MVRNWFLERAKSFAGALAAGVTSATLKAFEETLGMELFSPEVEALLVGSVVGFVTQQLVYWIPNKSSGPQP